MNAPQPSRPPLRALSPAASPRRASRPTRKLHSVPRSYRAIAVEIGMKLGVNLVLMVAALSALVKLVPYTAARQEKLQELQTEVNHVEDRVDYLHASFSRIFDPKQIESNMQQQSNRLAPGQRQIVLVSPSTRLPVSTDEQP